MKIEVKIESSNLDKIIVAMTYVNTVLLVGNPDNFRKWSNLYEWGNPELMQIGQFRITE